MLFMVVLVNCHGGQSRLRGARRRAAATEATPTEAAAERYWRSNADGSRCGGACRRRAHYVGFVPPALTSPFHVAMVDGATARSKELGWTLDVQAPASEGDFQAFVTTVQQLLEKGVEAISINPIGTDSAVTAVKAANEKGVPILAHNFITPFSEGDVKAYIGYDQWGGAEKLAAYTCELIAKKYASTPAETKGKVFILLGID